MPDNIQAAKVICRGGLNTNENYLELSETNPGSAVRLQNYEPSLTGGYRRINGFTALDATFDEVGEGSAEGAVLGVWSFYNTTSGEDEVIACRKDTGASTYSFYKKVDDGVDWAAYTTGFTHSTTNGAFTVYRVRAEIFNFGDGNKIIFVDGANFATIYDGTSWYQLESTNSGGSSDPGGNQVIDKPSVVTSFKNHIFLSGDTDSPAVIAHSAPKDPFTWTTAAGGGQVIYGFDVVQIKPFRDELFCFGRTSIKKIVADSSLNFLLNDVTINIGCIARDSVVEIGGNLIFWSSDGIRPIAGTERNDDIELSLLSQSIQQTIATSEINYDLDYLNAVVIRRKTQFRYFLSNEADDAADAYGILGAFRTRGTNQPTWEFGELVGIHSASSWSGYQGTDEIILHGGYDGVVYVQESGNSFNGSDITSIYTTPYLDFNNTQLRKTLKRLSTFVRAEGSFTVSIAVKFDWADPDVINPSDYTGGSTNASVTYGSGALYDASTSVYGGVAQPILYTDLQGSGFSVQFSYVTIGDFAPHTIQGFVTEFFPQGFQ